MEDFFSYQEGSICVCDKAGIIIYMNKKAMETFSDVIGKSLFDCHPPDAIEKIKELLKNGNTNAYTIEKNGKKKLIYQTPWRDTHGTIAGLIEYSFVIPFDMPHYIRK
jgi:PAS domain S-box-containing protein